MAHEETHMKENMTCSHCGCINEDLYEVELDGMTIEVCEDCAEALGFVRCSECDEWIPAEDAMTTADGETICESCYEDWFCTCEDCGEIIRQDDCYVIDRGMRFERVVCDSCSENYYRCDDCEELFSSRSVHADSNGTVICDDCYANHDWCTCDRCDAIIQMDDANWDDYEDRYLCDDCYSRARRNANFHDYYYKPNPEFKFRSSETHHEEFANAVLTFGVELEVDDGDDHLELANELAELNQPIYMKHDGSLGSEGVEIVTHPCSLAFHQYELRWAEIVRVCKANDFKSHDAGTCGLHIHVGRKAMGQTYEARRVTAGNLVILTEKLWGELVKFSRRTSGQLSDWACRPNIELDIELTDSELTDMALRTEYNGRYQACNLRNDATVEFRIFRGTLKRNTLIASIQLVSNLTKYAMTHTPTECKNATWADVVGTEQFKELNKYNAERGL